MKDRVRTWMPDDLDASVHVFDAFHGVTVRDMFRLGLPALAGFLAAGTVGMAAGSLVGGAAYLVRPRGDPVDVHAANAARHVIGTHAGSWPGVDRVDDGVAVLDDGTVVGVVHVSSVGLDMRPERAQEAVQATVADLFAEVEFPVELHSVQRRTSLDEYRTPDDAAVVTRHFAVVKAGSGRLTGSTAAAMQRVRERCVEVRNAVGGAEFAAEQVAGGRLRSLLDEVDFSGVRIGANRFAAGDGRTVRTVQVTGYPETVAAGWLADVLDVDGVVRTVQVVEPEDTDAVAKLRDRIVAELSVTRDPSRASELERKAEAVDRVTDRSARGDRPVRHGVVVAAVGADADEAAATLRRVKEVLRRHRIEFREPWLRMHRAAKTLSWFHWHGLGRRQVATCRSAAAAFPFAASDVIERGGIVVGRDTRSGTPVVLDRFGWDAGHVARMGKIGSGKSYAAKLAVLRSLDRYDDLEAVVIDPKQEYDHVADFADRVTRFTVEDRTEENTEELVGYVREAYRRGHAHDGKTLVVLDEAHRVLNDAHGRQVLGELVRESRDQEIAVTMVTQNAADFTQSQEGRNMLRQVDCYLLMRHQDVATSVEKFFNLSDREAVQLRKLRTGTDTDFSEAVIRGPVNTTLRIASTEGEDAVITGRTVSGLPVPVQEHEHAPEDRDEADAPDAEEAASTADALAETPIIGPLLAESARAAPTPTLAPVRRAVRNVWTALHGGRFLEIHVQAVHDLYGSLTAETEFLGITMQRWMAPFALLLFVFAAPGFLFAGMLLKPFLETGGDDG